MGLQLIFVVETNRACKSDWIYIKNTIDRFYTFDQTNVKLSPVYMNGRGGYKRKENEVKTLVSQYSQSVQNNKSVVIYCFDCDEYNSKPEDKNFLKEARDFCDKRGYEFIWFFKDIESVYLGRKVPDNQKKKEASLFMAKKRIAEVKEESLSATRYGMNASNILKILDKFIPPLDRK